MNKKINILCLLLLLGNNTLLIGNDIDDYFRNTLLGAIVGAAFCVYIDTPCKEKEEEGMGMVKINTIKILRTKKGGTNLNLKGALLKKADLIGASLYLANFNEANLNQADLNRANLILARFKNAKLKKTNFRNANLVGAVFRRADLEEADFTGANLSGASFAEAKKLSRSQINNGYLCDTEVTREDFFGGIILGLTEILNRDCKKEWIPEDKN